MPQRITIREWNESEKELRLLSELNARVHFNQFFDKKGPLGGKLGKDFPLLEVYQSLPEFFERIWAGLAKSFNKQFTGAYIYTAFKSDDPTETPVGFVKGSEWNVDVATRELLPDNIRNSNQIACLGSLYVAPEMQGLKIGQLLTSSFALAASKNGYDSMVTHAYAGNTSPKFFIEKTGASYIGPYAIPNFFDDDLLERQNLNRGDMPPTIPGVALFWGTEQFSNLLTIK